MGVFMAEVGSRGFVTGIGGMLFSALAFGILAKGLKSEIPNDVDVIRHIAETADLSTPLSLEDIAAYLGLACGVSFLVTL
ncbi:MAG: hypothetical protein NBV63_02085, partial [Candidatus Pacebacteria bacterium]|nr:hypothetical protein [Candidatus Paceibacterota bacterium]